MEAKKTEFRCCRPQRLPGFSRPLQISLHAKTGAWGPLSHWAKQEIDHQWTVCVYIIYIWIRAQVPFCVKSVEAAEAWAVQAFDTGVRLVIRTREIYRGFSFVFMILKKTICQRWVDHLNFVLAAKLDLHVLSLLSTSVNWLVQFAEIVLKSMVTGRSIIAH